MIQGWFFSMALFSVLLYSFPASSASLDSWAAVTETPTATPTPWPWQPIHVFSAPKPDSLLHAGNFSLDGSKILVGYNNVSLIYDARTFELLHTVDCQEGKLLAPSTNQIITMGYPVRLIDSHSLDVNWTIEYPGLWMAKFSPSKKYFLTGNAYDKCYIRLFEWNTKNLIHEFIAHPNAELTVEFTPDEKKLILLFSAVHSFYNEEITDRWDQIRDQIYVYDLNTKTQKEITLRLYHHLDLPLTVIPGQDQLACVIGGCIIQIYNYETGQVVEEFRHPDFDAEIGYLVSSPDGRFLLIGYGLETHLMDLRTKKIVRRFPGGTMFTQQTDCNFSPDGRRMITAYFNQLMVWDISELYDPTEPTPTVPTLPPTPTPTPATSYPNVLAGNLSAEWLIHTQDLGADFTVDPRNGHFYFHVTRKEGILVRDLILGPIAPHQTFSHISEIPIYAELPYPDLFYVSYQAFMMTAQGVFYLSYEHHLIRVLPDRTVEEIDAEGMQDFFINDLYTVKEGDRIPGVESGDLICLVYGPRYSEYIYPYQLYRLKATTTNPQLEWICTFALNDMAEAMTIGPDRRLYILCQRKIQKDFDSVPIPVYNLLMRLESNGMLTDVYHLPQMGNWAQFRFWPWDQAFYFYLYPHPFIWRLSLENGQFHAVVKLRDGLKSRLALSPMEDRLYFLASDRLDRFPDFMASISLNRPFPPPAGTLTPFAFPTALQSSDPTYTSTPTRTPTRTPQPSPTSRYTDTPTPTVTPTFTPSMTFTPVNHPVSNFTDPNLKAQFITYYNEPFPAIAVDPRNQDIFLFHNGEDRQPVIWGPITKWRVMAATETLPVYAELPYRENYTQKPQGFSINSQGILYIYYGGTIYRIPRQGVVELVYPKDGSPMDCLDIRIVPPGYSMFGLKEGDLLLLRFLGTSSWLNYFSLSSINPETDDSKPESLLTALLPEEPKTFSFGPEGFLYLAGSYPDSTQFTLYRLERNGSFTRLMYSESFHGVADKLEYWPKDQSLVLYTTRNNHWVRIHPQTSQWAVEFNSPYSNSLDLEPYESGNKLLVMDQVENQGTLMKFIEAVELETTHATPTSPPWHEPFPTPLPEDHPTVTPIPTPTQAVTLEKAEGYQYRPVWTGSTPDFLLTAHLRQSILYSVRAEDRLKRLAFYRHTPINPSASIPEYDSEFMQSVRPNLEGVIVNIAAGHDGTVAVMGLDWGSEYWTKKVVFIRHADGDVYSGYVNMENRCLYVVSDTAKCPWAKPGEVLSGNQILHTPYGSYHELVIEETSLPQDIDDYTEGPDGYIYCLYKNKIHRLNDQGKLQEWRDPSFENARQFVYNPLDQSFYITSGDFGFFEIVRLSASDQSRSSLGSIQIFTNAALFVMPGQAGVYVIYSDLELGLPSVLHIRPEELTITPTPTPIPGWFVLDGFGGIHSTNPNVTRPNLPYLGGFNIMRDIEPDPLGRGWYMLDGFGGVHTSSPELPLPSSLPYFGGFDIARNLEVKQKGDRLEFYMLDGFGTVHTTDTEFQYGNLPWFGFDIAQDLVADPQKNEWHVLDRFGALHNSAQTSLILPLGDVFQIPVAKSIVTFPDGTSLLLDGFGGRHTNPANPTADVVNGLPSGFYFPGWEIIQDVEVVPENWK